MATKGTIEVSELDYREQRKAYKEMLAALERQVLFLSSLMDGTKFEKSDLRRYQKELSAIIRMAEAE
jgi:hypothetical protein